LAIHETGFAVVYAPVGLLDLLECWANLFISAIAAGMSLTFIQIFEKMKLKRHLESNSAGENVIK